MIKGTIFVHHNTATGHLDVHAVNHGDSPGALTHNMRATEVEIKNEAGVAQHDDNSKFGHGSPVSAGADTAPQTATLAFAIGDTYTSEDLMPDGRRIPRPVQIIAGTWLRVGFRQRSFATLQIPPPGQIVEIPYEAMLPQSNSSMSSARSQYSYGFVGWDVAPLKRDGSHIPAALQALLAQKSPHVVTGEVRIVPVADKHDPERLAGWDVVYENRAQGKPAADATHGFTATVVLVNYNGDGEKNAGLGLESMPCPAGGTEASQHIVAGGDYGAHLGVVAQPGGAVRLGIRGYSVANTTLPGLNDGARTLDLSAFERTFGTTQSDWFDGDKLGLKLGEKKNRVTFFSAGRAINASLPDTIYTGAEAFERAEFKLPPRVVVTRVAADGEHAAGWRVDVTNLLPDHDNIGPIAYPLRPRIDVDGALTTASFLRATTLTHHKREASWFIPIDATAGDAAIKKGTSLIVDTGPLGWRGTIDLPGARDRVDTSENPARFWVLRESDYLRAGMLAAVAHKNP